MSNDNDNNDDHRTHISQAMFPVGGFIKTRNQNKVARIFESVTRFI